MTAYFNPADLDWYRQDRPPISLITGLEIRKKTYQKKLVKKGFTGSIAGDTVYTKKNKGR